jgi:hypothetical protein
MQIRRLCLQRTREAEPRGMGSQAQPGNQLLVLLVFTRYQALPGNADLEALPPVHARGRASGHGFPGTAWEPVTLPKIEITHTHNISHAKLHPSRSLQSTGDSF